MEPRLPPSVYIGEPYHRWGNLLGLQNGQVLVEIPGEGVKVLVEPAQVWMQRQSAKFAVANWCWRCGVYDNGLVTGKLCQDCRSLDTEIASLKPTGD